MIKSSYLQYVYLRGINNIGNVFKCFKSCTEARNIGVVTEDTQLFSIHDSNFLVSVTKVYNPELHKLSDAYNLPVINLTYDIVYVIYNNYCFQYNYEVLSNLDTLIPLVTNSSEDYNFFHGKFTGVGNNVIDIVNGTFLNKWLSCSCKMVNDMNLEELIFEYNDLVRKMELLDPDVVKFGLLLDSLYYTNSQPYYNSYISWKKLIDDEEFEYEPTSFKLTDFESHNVVYKTTNYKKLGLMFDKLIPDVVTVTEFENLDWHECIIKFNELCNKHGVFIGLFDVTFESNGCLE